MERQRPQPQSVNSTPAGAGIATPGATVQGSELPPQLERYLCQPASEDSTTWGLVAGDPNKKTRAGWERVLQNVAAFDVKFDQTK